MNRAMAWGLLAAAGLCASAHAGVVTNMTSDDAFEYYVSTDDTVQGTLVGTGFGWGTTFNFNAALTPGVTNYLHVKVTDVAAVVGAWIGDFTVDPSFQFDNGGQFLTTDTVNWRYSTITWGNWNLAAHSDGANGVGPWGTRPGIDSSAQWLNYTDDTGFYASAFYSTTLNAVPLPSGVGMAGLGLLAVGARRRRAN